MENDKNNTRTGNYNLLYQAMLDKAAMGQVLPE